MEQIVKKLDQKACELKDALRELDLAVGDLQQKHYKKIKPITDDVINLKHELVNTIEENRDQFTRSKTMTLFGIKWGLLKGKGRVEISNEKKSIELIKKNLSEDKQDSLINIKESIAKSNISLLDAMDIKKIGVKIVNSDEKPFISFTDNNIEKYIKTLIKDDTIEVI